MITTPAIEIARYLIWLAVRERPDDPDVLTPLKLQKLLYYVQGWALAEWSRPAFPDEVQAWREGPVVPSVFDAFRGRRELDESLASDGSSLSEAERALVRSVWDAYKRHSAYALSDMTHAEAPWKESYLPADASGRCRRPIPVESIERTFRQRRERVEGRVAERRERLRRLAGVNTARLTGRPAV